MREILEITGLTIQETGKPGKGARFEITVPNGKWRILSEEGSFIVDNSQVMKTGAMIIYYLTAKVQVVPESSIALFAISLSTNL